MFGVSCQNKQWLKWTSPSCLRALFGWGHLEVESQGKSCITFFNCTIIKNAVVLWSSHA